MDICSPCTVRKLLTMFRCCKDQSSLWIPEPSCRGKKKKKKKKKKSARSLQSNLSEIPSGAQILIIK